MRVISEGADSCGFTDRRLFMLRAVRDVSFMFIEAVVYLDISIMLLLNLFEL